VKICLEMVARFWKWSLVSGNGPMFSGNGPMFGGNGPSFTGNDPFSLEMIHFQLGKCSFLTYC